MFFVLSKTLGRLLLPVNFALALLALWLLLRLLRRAERARRIVGGVAVLTLLVFSLPVAAKALLYPLEAAYSRPSSPPGRVATIVMLTGMTRHARPGSFELTDAADRFVETLRLAHQHREAKIIMSGGSGDLLPSDRREAVDLAQLAQELGIPRERLLIDAEARNTRENAVYSARLLERVNGPGAILLVTSAQHMPRALACFRRVVSRPIVPWPVDNRGSALNPWIIVPRLDALALSQRAINEYLGLVAYRLAGYL